MRETSGPDLRYSAARAFADDAVPFADEFIKCELPATFIDDLKAKASAFEQAGAERTSSRTSHVAATGAIVGAVRKAVALVKQLDPIMKNKLRGDTFLMGEWNNARRMERAWTSKPTEVHTSTEAAGSAAQS
ncbi:MAG TPA: hypothetical protein VE422_42775 [Terriglobia bacterium]|nr:hypothetical protein [Terriglobia bacterium]